MAEGVLFEMAKDLLESIGKPAFQKVSTWRSARADLRKLERTLRMIKARVIDAEKRSKEENTELIKEWLRRLRVVFYKADDLFDDVFTAKQRKRRMQGNMVKKVRFLFSSSSPLLFNRQVAREIKAIRKELDAIESDMNGLNLRECDHTGDSHFSMSHLMNNRETISFVQKGDIIGRDDDVDKIINEIFDPKFAEEVVSVIPIVGFGGIGKTTVAQLVFNDERVMNQFELTKWACVPEINNPNEVMRTICNTFTGANCREMVPEQLQSRIRESIGNKKYFLVLDDIWDESRDRWLQVMSLLKCGAKGSKVIVTTRSFVVANVVGTVPSYKLGLLKEEQSWELFKRFALKEGQEEGNPNFTRIGKDIVDRCANVPLAIRVIGSLLYSKDTEQEWLLVRDGHLSKTGMTEDGNIMPVLKLSYDFLPSPLKQCFAYCSMFEKDDYFQKNKLVRLWMAQGYIKASKESLDLEEVGDLYFLELIRRNFFQDVQDDWANDVSCKMHDLLHDLALHVTSEEDIREDTRISSNLVEEDTPSFLATNKMRSSLFNNDSRSILAGMIPNFETLRALEFDWDGEKTLPDSIWKLRHLRYLNIQNCHNVECLPDAITKLENLQTLNLYYCIRLKQLPRGFTRLSNLRHLGLFGSELIDFPPGFEKMRCLRELSTFVVGKSNGVDALANLDLRGKLKIRFGRWRRNTMLEAGRVNLKGKQHLMELTLDLSFKEEEVTPSTNHDMELLLECLMFPPNLKKLQVIGYSGEMFPRRMVEDLPYLLPKLVSVSISACKSIRQIPRLSSLPYLKFLTLQSLEELEYIEEDGWGDNGEPCPALTGLTLINLPKLKGWWSSPGVKSHRLPVILSSVYISRCQQTLVELFMSHYGEASSSPSSAPIHLEIWEICNLLSFPINFCTFIWEICISHCNELTSLTAVSPNSSIRFLRIDCCPRLKKVHDGLQHLLALEELVIWGCNELEIWEIKTWPHLRSLRSLEIRSVSKLEVLPSSIGCLTTLQKLKVSDLSNLTALPEEITQLPQLRELEISYCDELTSLPQSFCNLSSLQQLIIHHCTHLKTRCRPPNGEDWPLIKHIPKIHIDYEKYGLL